MSADATNARRAARLTGQFHTARPRSPKSTGRHLAVTPWSYLDFVIRNVVMMKLKDGVNEDQVARAVDAMMGLQVPGLINLSAGRDAGLRDGNLDVALIVDLEDDDAYRGYDEDPEHQRIRRELIAPIAERVERCQYRI
jgi:hypothetical protein